MGTEIDRESFDAEDYRRFGERLRQNVEALRETLSRPGFGAGEPSIGAELELNLIDEKGRPALDNRRVWEATRDPRLTLEVDRFNLEINARPSLLQGMGMREVARDMEDALANVRRVARGMGIDVLTIGILPTLVESDLCSSTLTDGHRYRALSNSLRRLRQEPFRIDIRGRDHLQMEVDEVTVEGANTSFQLHLRVEPERFGALYNAVQFATAPALAFSGNSPRFLGRRLWDETRIALFRQSVDDRGDGDADAFRPARVSFGHGWVRQGAFELFDESVALHEPLLPVLSDEDPLAVVRAGGVPRLAELRLHHGTVWRWNRAVFDPDHGGHLRIEMRALPSGPTVVDNWASGAFMAGLALALAPRMDSLVNRVTFGQARRNFYNAARDGVDAELLWTHDTKASPTVLKVDRLLEKLLPLAYEGLVGAGVDRGEADRLLGIMADRAARRQTGARWQEKVLDAWRGGMADPMASMLRRYHEHSWTGAPVHTWPMES